MKKLLVLAALSAMAFGAQAAYLFWQTGTETSFNGHQITGYNVYAMLSDGTKSLASKTVMDTDGEPVAPSAGGYAGGQFYIVDLGTAYDSGTYSFYVEMMGDEGVIGVSESATYDDLVRASSIQPAGIALTLPVMWTGGSFSAPAPEPAPTPEPTSGLLLLLGVAGLALKRKRA